MWSAKQGAVTVRGYNVVVAFTLTNSDTNETIIDEVFSVDLTPDRLAKWVEQQIKNLEARDAAKDVLDATVGSDIELPRDKVLTREEQDKRDAETAANSFFAALSDYNAARVSFDKGLVTQAAVDAKAIAVKSAYLPEYERDPRFR